MKQNLLLYKKNASAGDEYNWSRVDKNYIWNHRYDFELIGLSSNFNINYISNIIFPNVTRLEIYDCDIMVENIKSYFPNVTSIYLENVISIPKTIYCGLLLPYANQLKEIIFCAMANVYNKKLNLINGFDLSMFNSLEIFWSESEELILNTSNLNTSNKFTKKLKFFQCLVDETGYDWLFKVFNSHNKNFYFPNMNYFLAREKKNGFDIIMSESHQLLEDNYIKIKIEKNTLGLILFSSPDGDFDLIFTENEYRCQHQYQKSNSAVASNANQNLNFNNNTRNTN